MHLPTILIALTGLDIGGTETHAVVLCKHLKDMGYNVIVASNGGIYEKEIVDYGIRHYKVSLNTKKPWEVVRAFFKLITIVKSEKVDLIHAHARIPAFICNIVSRVLNVKFITTAHAKFRSNFILKYISAWGQKTIAVSNDIKEHLVKAFGVNEKNIIVVTNGIDTDQFNSKIQYNNLLSEFNIDNSYKRIVWVSRIDDDLGNTVLSLIDSIDEVCNKFEKVALFIVGSGNRLDEIRKMALQKNNDLGKQVVFVTGRRTDINNILNLADVFVGISRAALEAMACEKPVVLAGPWSFVGVLDENIFGVAEQDNFTGRNTSNPVTSSMLSDSIIKILSMSIDESNQLGKLGRTIVLDNYSALKMTQKTAEVYQNVINC